MDENSIEILDTNSYMPHCLSNKYINNNTLIFDYESKDGIDDDTFNSYTEILIRGLNSSTQRMPQNEENKLVVDDTHFWTSNLLSTASISRIKDGIKINREFIVDTFQENVSKESNYQSYYNLLANTYELDRIKNDIPLLFA